jgi:protein-S-isoprenylcysteine O-methyltransferase Ste14
MTHDEPAGDWRSFSAFSAFIVALFVEMYGFPLTLFPLSGWLQARYPGLDIMSHDAGHLWLTLFGVTGNPHFGVPHIASNLLIFGDFILLSAAWSVLHQAQRRHALATTGVYARVRHPQYAAFIIIMAGFLLQWPTLLTLAMFPVLVTMYVRLGHIEEAEARRVFAAAHDDCAARVSAWFPRFGEHGIQPGRVA